MIEFVVTCDRCGTKYTLGENLGINEAKKEARKKRFSITRDGKTFCPACAHDSLIEAKKENAKQREFKKRKYKSVSGEEFDRFLKEYPRELDKHVVTISTPMIIEYHDFELGTIPLSLVASRYEDEDGGVILTQSGGDKEDV